MQRDPRAYLWEVQQAAAAIVAFTEDLDFAAYSQSRLVQSAVERQCEIIGEALSQLSKTDAVLASRLPDIRRAIGFRNLLIHGYHRVDHAEVWEVIQSDLPNLLIAVSALLGSLGSP